MIQGANQERELSIHYLRAIAALMVVAMHAFSYGLVPVDDLAQISWLKRGVALFFVISGFVMVTSTSGRAVTPGAFMLRRIIRIVPLYWVMTLAWAAIATDWDLLKLAGSLAFVPTPDPVSGALRSPVLEPGWTLNFEMFFYAVFALSLWLRPVLRLPVVATVLTALVLLGSAAEAGPLLNYYSDGQLLLFVGGMAIAAFNLRLPVLFVPAGFAALIFYSPIAPSEIVGVYLPALAIVLGARSLDGRLPQWKLPTLLGDASYAIYLGHLFVIQLADRFVAPYLPGPLTLVLILLAASLFGVQLHRALELPLGAWLRQHLPHATRMGTRAKCPPPVTNMTS